VPKRLTYHPGPDVAVGWTRDGKSVLVRSSRNSYSRFARLFTMPVDGVFPSEVPLPQADVGAYSPDGAYMAYTPLAPAFQSWKRYRGGRTSALWIAKLADSSIERIPRANSNDFTPMWIGDKVYFLSDRNGAFTLFSYDTKLKKVAQALPNTSLDIKSASAGPDAIVYEQFGSIYLFDLKSQKSKKVEITLTADLPEVRPRIQRVSNSIDSAAISPAGARAVFAARGEIFTVPAEKGDVRNLTNTPGAAERDPSWSPDGKWIAYFSDATGEYALNIAQHNGQGDVRTFKLSTPQTFYYNPVWSPDSKKIAFTDKGLSVSYLELDSGQVVKVDTDRYDGPRRIRHVAWAPDSKWLAYTKQLRNTLRAVLVYSLDQKEKYQVTDGMSDATVPVFDRDGKYMYFLASTDTGLNVGWRDMSAYFRPVTNTVYLVVLDKALPSPLAPESDEENVEEPKKSEPAKKDGQKAVTVKFDAADVEQRIIPLPMPARNYTHLMPGKAGVLFIGEAPEARGPGGSGATVHKFDLKTRKTEKYVDGIAAFELSANGEKALFRKGQQWTIAATGAAPKPGEGALKLEGMETRIEPQTEWRQMYAESWRILRDFFYDPHHHGVNIPETMKRYEPYVDAAGSRTDLNYVLSEALGEFTCSHLYISGGDVPQPKRVRGGLLGSDYTIDSGRYRFAKVYSGESWNPELRAPLTQPGVNVTAGEYLLAVNGNEIRASDNLYSFFEGSAGRQVVVKVGPKPDGSGARDVTVIPVENEMRLRNLAWIEGNRKKVEQLSGGRLGYVYLPDTSMGGYTNFNRYYFAQTGKDGAVVDERYNGGGSQPDYIIDYMNRKVMFYRSMREGEDVNGPLAGIFGPKAMIINEYAGSGGDSMPWYFRKAGVGPLVGKRTWGGLVGGLGGYPSLIDGGSVTAPAVGFWDPDTKEWVAENTGIDPDFEVEQDPKAVREGRDPQLEKAVEVVLAALKKQPAVKHVRPAYPNYHKPAAASVPAKKRKS
jgi:tricorn protease